MGDYLKDLFLDPGIIPGITIKQEPHIGDTSSMSQSASVPIPPKRDANDYRNLDFDYASSPIYSDIQLSGQTQGPVLNDSNNSWGLSTGLSRLINSDDILKSEPFIHMDQDDIFQVDEADLIQGPTLAELNANDDNLLGDWNFDDLILPEDAPYSLLEKTSLVQVRTNHLNNNVLSCPSQSLYQRDSEMSSSFPSGSFDYYKCKTQNALSPGSQNSSNSSFQSSSPLKVSGIPPKHSTLQELLVKKENNESMLGQSYTDKNTSLPLHSPHSVKFPRNTLSGLSSSAPTHLGLEQIWQRREPRKHLLSTSSLVEAGSTSSLSTGGLLSPELPDFSLDEESDDDSDAHYEDFSSDNDSDDDDRTTRGSSKKERYFWQYNVQAKGPKGQRLVLKSKMEDPHHLNEVTDPVFSPDCSVRGIKHSGKARKGDGNDLTPNPKKLHNIGKELDKLSRYINDMTPVSELPFNVRTTSRKEKNKLASRACRLKKKAQHEANKIKLSGLELEHKKLISGLNQAKQIIMAKLSEQSNQRQEELTMNLEKIIKNSTKMKMAGHTTDYVNKILDKFREGGVAPSTSYLDDM